MPAQVNEFFENSCQKVSLVQTAVFTFFWFTFYVIHHDCTQKEYCLLCGNDGDMQRCGDQWCFLGEKKCSNFPWWKLLTLSGQQTDNLNVEVNIYCPTKNVEKTEVISTFLSRFFDLYWPFISDHFLANKMPKYCPTVNYFDR